VEIPNGFETLRATVETTDFAPIVYVTNTACGANWITCAPNKVANISWPAAGTYHIVVDGKTAADQGEFTLKLEMIPPG
jgi:urocanate hydratase